MKKLFALILTSIGLLPFTACITSLQPLVTYDKIITDERIAGNWIAKNEKEIENKVFKVEPLSSNKFFSGFQRATVNEVKVFSFTGDYEKDSIFSRKAYSISYEENGVSYNLIGALMKSGNHLFMDIYPAYMFDSTKSKEAPSPYDFNYDYLPGFTIAKVNFTADGLTLNFVDGDFIERLTEDGKIKLKYESDPMFNSFIITASSRELQSFLEKYADDERIFSKEKSVSFVRQPVL